MLCGVLEFTDVAVIAGLILLLAGSGAAARAYARPVDPTGSAGSRTSSTWC